MALSALNPTTNFAAQSAAQSAATPPAPPLQTDAAITVTPPAPASTSGSSQDPSAQAGRGARGESDDGEGNPVLNKALDELNAQMQAWSTHLHFDLDRDIGRVVVSVLDSVTGETLRTIPTEEMVKAAKMIAKLQGLTVHTTA